MLPSRGYFKSINCPFFDSGICDRPHCHYRHFRKDKSSDDAMEEEESSNYNLFLYKESTQKHNSSVSYTPTPISELKKRHIPVKSAPSLLDPLKTKAEYEVSSKKKMKEEYVPTVVDSTHGSNRGMDSCDLFSLKGTAPHVYKATKISTNRDQHSTESFDNYLNIEEDSEDGIDFNFVNDELSFIDEILMEFNKSGEETPIDISIPDIKTQVALEETKQNEDDSKTKFKELSKDSTIKEHKNTSDKENKSCKKKKDYRTSRDHRASREHTICKEPADKKKADDNSPPSNSDYSSCNVKKPNKSKSSSIKSEKKSTSEHTKKTHKNETELITKNDVIDFPKQKTDLAEKTHSLNLSLCSNKHKHKDSSSSLKPSKKKKISKEKSHKIHEMDAETLSMKSHLKSSSFKITQTNTPDKKRNKASEGTKYKDSKKNKEDSKSKHKSSGDHKIVKDRKRSSNQNPKLSELESHKHSSEGKSRSTLEKVQKRSMVPKRKSAEDSESEIEIISDSESIIVIDSEEENVEETSENEKDRSPTRLFLPDDSEFSFESEDSCTEVYQKPQTVAVVRDEAVELDHRVKSNKKARISLGHTWRPEPRPKKPDLLKPGQRIKLFRSMEQEENENSSTSRIKIGCVPNVHSLLEEKKRIFSIPKSIAKEKMLQAHKRLQASSGLHYISKNFTNIALNEEKDEPPRVIEVVHPLRDGADKDTRQSYLNAFYQVTRQLTKPGTPYSWAQKKCMEGEKEVYLNYTRSIYEKEIISLIMKAKSKIQGFTQRYYDQLNPRRSALFPPELMKKLHCKDGTVKWEEVSLYSALKKHLLSEQQLIDEGYPRRKVGTDLVCIDQKYLDRYSKIKNDVAPPRGCYKCVMCTSHYTVDKDGLSTDTNGCNYHTKSAFKMRSNSERLRICCKKPTHEPCTYSKYHSTELKDFQNLEGYKETEEPMGLEPEEGWGVFSVDCEMYYSTTGIELGRVSVVNAEQRCVYDAFVKPQRPVTDYCYKFSGLTEENLFGSNTTFEEVQAVMLSLFNKKTILIGHSLENDLRALKIIHNNVVDTAIVYSSQGRKCALKSLANLHLNEKIQEGENQGHDSYEDANTCLKLMRLKVFKEATLETKKKAPTIPTRYPSKDVCFS